LVRLGFVGHPKGGGGSKVNIFFLFSADYL
jgi:hypothetical protein